jgi:hypothetical protein
VRDDARKTGIKETLTNQVMIVVEIEVAHVAPADREEIWAPFGLG